MVGNVIILVYFVVVNVYSLVRMGADRNRMLYGGCVLPERSLFLVALCGGSIGTLAGMYLFKHKVHKFYFKAMLFLVLTLQLAFVVIKCLVYRM